MRPHFYLLAASVGLMWGQQPFLTDDADVSPVGHFHLELISEFDRLQFTSYPTLRQSTTRFQLTYGLWENLEIGFDAPLIAIYNASQSGTPNTSGFGDFDLQMKYRLRTEHDGSKMPAVTVGFYVETPTGNVQKQLGSGIADYWLSGILQKHVTARTVVRLNSGILFSGNTLTGAIGIRSAHGKIFTGASSVTYQLNDRLLVGAEIAGAFTQQFDLGKAQVQSLFGVKYALTKTLGFDFAITGGKYEGSPRLGGAFGFSFDF